MFPDIRSVLYQLILEFLFHMRRFRAQLWHAVYRVNCQMKTVKRIERHHLRRLEQLGYTVTLTPKEAA